MSTRYELSGCAVCGSREAGALATRDDIRSEMEELWAFHTRRLRAETPPQRLADRVVFSQEPPLHVVRCRACGLVYRNPRERGRELVEAYAGEEPAHEVLDALFAAQRPAALAQARRLTEVVGRPGRVLEVGSYLGTFLHAAAELGWRVEGVDVNPHAIAYARARGLRVNEGTLSALGAGPRYDALAIWNTFEQLPDPRAAVRAARTLLAPGGVLALRVPNGAVYAALRRLLRGPLRPAGRAILAHNNLLGFPYRHGFTPRTLRRLLEAHGFRVVRTVGDALVPTADEWTRDWAAREARVVRALLRTLARVGPAPWFEVYARPVEPG